MKLTNLTFSSNLDSGRVRKYQGFVLLYFFLFIALVLAFAGILQAPRVEPDIIMNFFFFFACFLAGQGFFIVTVLSRVESDLADIKRRNEPVGSGAARGESQADGVLNALHGSGS